MLCSHTVDILFVPPILLYFFMPSVSRRPNNDRNAKGRGDGRGGRAPARDGKRAYDRRSGTGRGKEIKKDGGGARNWGSDKAEAKKMEGKIVEEEVKEDKPVTTATEPVEEGEAAPATEAEEAPAPVEPKPEDNTISYADYMAAKGKKEETNLREVENEFQGKSAAVKQEEENFLVMGGGKAKKNKKKKADEKKTVDVGFRVVRDFFR
jgi:plasminogen activator inhibitor 1 RNA-binding protein